MLTWTSLGKAKSRRRSVQLADPKSETKVGKREKHHQELGNGNEVEFQGHFSQLRPKGTFSPSTGALTSSGSSPVEGWVWSTSLFQLKMERTVVHLTLY